MAQTLQNVREQYEDLPYPPRNPDDEKKRLVSTVADCPDLLNHICFGGERDFSKPFRILVAGGGTGDSTVFLAHVFRDMPQVRITYLDFSEASRKIAEKRIKARDIKPQKVKFITDSILNIPNLKLGEFDLIQCTGVLHHLADPEAGLKALTSVLADDGIISLMLYGTYGRYAIYPIQDMMRRINKNELNKNQKIKNTVDALNSFPAGNYFTENLKSMADLTSASGIYDLFLHDQDRAYTVPEVYEFVKSADLEVVEFYTGYKLGKRDFLLPENYVKNPALLAKIKKLPLPDQYAVSEVMNSRIKKQQFFAAKKPAPEIELCLDVIPSFSMLMPANSNIQLSELLKNSPKQILNFAFQQVPLQVNNTENLPAIFSAIDGNSTLREIFTKIGGQSPEDLLEEFRPAYRMLNNNYFMFLRKPGLMGFKTLTN